MTLVFRRQPIAPTADLTLVPEIWGNSGDPAAIRVAGGKHAEEAP